VSSSLGYTDWYTDADYDGNTAPSTIAADLAAARGLLVVNAAGNAGCGDGDIRLIVPADGDSVLTVGASTFSGERATFSSCGPTSDGRIKPDVIAPGQGVWTALPNTGMYQPGNGTSFSTPLVSGVCALLLQHDPTLTPFGLIALLRSTADRAIKPLVTYGWGLVQAVAAAGIDTNSIDPVRPDICPTDTLEVASIQIWPNPAKTGAKILVPEGSEGVYQIYSLAGRLVYQGDIAAGMGTWDGTNVAGERVATGVYLVRVKTQSHEKTLKLAWLPRDSRVTERH
jgi:subtilisin family serine protease